MATTKRTKPGTPARKAAAKETATSTRTAGSASGKKDTTTAKTAAAQAKKARSRAAVPAKKKTPAAGATAQRTAKAPAKAAKPPVKAAATKASPALSSKKAAAKAPEKAKKPAASPEKAPKKAATKAPKEKKAPERAKKAVEKAEKTTTSQPAPAAPAKAAKAEKASSTAPSHGGPPAPLRSHEGGGLLSQRAKAPERRTTGYTDERWLTHQRKALDTERATYVEQARSLRAEAESLVEEMEPGDVQFDDESGEGGTVTVERERDLALSAQAMQTVEEIDHSLQKVAGGTYGICENCGRLIPKPRLEALPFARLCIDCKSGGLSRR